MKKFEGLRSKMKGKDTDEIIKSVEGKSPEYKMTKGIDHGIYEIVELAIKEGGDFDHYSILWAIDRGNIDILNLLIENEIGLHEQILIVKQNKSSYDFAISLEKMGIGIDTVEYTNFEPSTLDKPGRFIIFDFISEHRKYLSKKHDVYMHSVSDEMWNNSIENDIKPKLENILNRYELKLSDKETFTYGMGNLRVKLNIPEITKNDKKIINILKEGLDDVNSFYDIIIDNL